jgi:small-conductance mechanosensitive channel
MKFKKKHIIYIVLGLIFVAITVLALYSYFVEVNFISTAFNDYYYEKYDLTPADIQNPYTEVFWGQYILPFIIFTLVAIILVVLWRLVIRAIKERVTPSITNTLRILGDIIIIPFCIIAYLNRFEAFKGTLIGIAALLGTAIGFASTTTIGNLLAGLYLIISRPFIVGDYIIITEMDTEGVVRELTVNYTKVDQPDGNTAILPNNGLLNKWIINTKKFVPDESEKGLQIRFRKKGTTYYTYPLKWACDTEEIHEICVEAFKKTEEKHKDVLEEEVSWFVLKRDKFHRTYQLNLTVTDAHTLINLSGDFMNTLEEEFGKIRKKYY